MLCDVVEDHADVWPVPRLREAGFPQPILEALEGVTRRDGEGYEAFVVWPTNFKTAS